ncbi:MAG TPA: hypothetical protein VGF45_23375, partial [Polyangia bacterium]
SFDQCLTELVQKQLVTYDEAASNATNAADFALHFRGFSKGGGTNDEPSRVGPAPGAVAAGGGSGFQIDRFKE